MGRVLVGPFGEVARVAVGRWLDDEGLEVVDAAGEDPAGVVALAAQAGVDTVVVDLDADGGPTSSPASGSSRRRRGFSPVRWPTR